EDGIRDLIVTGVQTCALPIWTPRSSRRLSTTSRRARQRWCGLRFRPSPQVRADGVKVSRRLEENRLMWITRVSINNPVFATMVMVGIVVLGVFSYARLRVEQMPDVTLPFVDVETAYPGASPEVVETDVSKPIEYAVNTVSGVKRIYSNSREGRSQVFVEFRLGTDVTRAIQDARDKIALVRPNFPRDVKDPQVIRVEIEDNRPTVSLAVLSPTVE